MYDDETDSFEKGALHARDRLRDSVNNRGKIKSSLQTVMYPELHEQLKA